MSPATTGIVSLIVLLAMIAGGLPIAFCMLIVGTAGLAYLISWPAALTKLAYTPFDQVISYDLSALAAFMLMAQLLFAAGFGTDLYKLASKWLGNLRGGLAMATIGGCAGFSAMSASSLATSVTIGLVAVPEMRKYGYDNRLSIGSVAAGGTMGILIPPSGLLIIYGILTETSIGKLFIAGLIPGATEALFYMVTIFILCRLRPQLGPPGPKTSWREKFGSLGNCGEAIGLIIFVLGGLIIGWFTPTEAGSIGCAGAIVFSLIRRRLNWQKLKTAIIEAIKTTGMLYFVLIGAFVFKYFLAVTTIPFILADFISGMALPPLAVMALVILMYIILGCFMEGASMVLLTIPIFFPLAMEYGFSAIWFGIIIVRVMEVGMITPPIGINVYALSGIFPDVPATTIFRGIFPFLVSDILHIAMLLFFPAVVLFLPNLM